MLVNLKPLLDDTAKILNKTWLSDEKFIKRQIADFESSIRTVVSIFGENYSFRKWNGKKYESALNRAIFDIIMYYFDSDQTRESTKDKNKLVIESFKRLCVDEEFRNSIEGTTKSINSIYTRLRKWGEALLEIGVNIRLPRLERNKIIRDA